MKPCVIFDLDGTLCDTSADLLAAANAALAGLGHDVALDVGSDEDRATALRGGRAMLRLGLSRLGDVDEAQVDAGYQPLLDAYARDISRHTTFYPGARDAVARLRGAGYAVGICTNKPEGLARQLMTDLGALDDFHSLIGADTLPVRKPDPAPLFAAVDGAGGDRSRAVLVGDTKTDRDTSANAGIASILVTFAPGGTTVADLSPDALLGDFGDLDGIVRDLIG